MNDLKIRIESNIDHAAALQLVAKIVANGRISNSRHGPAYCAATVVTTIEDGHKIEIWAYRTATMDVFRILEVGRHG